MTVHTQTTLINDTIDSTQRGKLIRARLRGLLTLFSILAMTIISGELAMVTAAQLSEHCSSEISMGRETKFFLAIRTTENGHEVRPTWGDCEQVVRGLQGAGFPVRDWQCSLKWGTCPAGGYGSCIMASFFSTPVTLTGIGINLTGGSVSFAPIGNKINEIAGPTRCRTLTR